MTEVERKEADIHREHRQNVILAAGLAVAWFVPSLAWPALIAAGIGQFHKEGVKNNWAGAVARRIFPLKEQKHDSHGGHGGGHGGH